MFDYNEKIIFVITEDGSICCMSLRSLNIKVGLHIGFHGYRRPGYLYLDHQTGSKQTLLN